MTTAQGSGVVDMSGVVSSILRTHQDAVVGYQRMVTGDPDAVAACATRHEDQASALADTSTDLGRRADGLAASWEGSAHDAYRSADSRLTAQLDGIATTLRQEAQRLAAAASLLRAGRAQVDSVLSRFQQSAQLLIAQARTAAANAVGTFVQAAQQLGDSAVTAAKAVADQVGEALGGLYGLTEETGGTPEAEKAEGAEGGDEKHRGSSEVDQKKAARRALAAQPWFRDWHRATYGRDPDPEHPRLGPLSWFDNDDVLDGRRRPRSNPSVFGNTGWYSVTGDGLASAAAPLKANTPFGTLADPPEDASAAAKAWHDTNITLATTGNQTLFDGSVVDSKASGTADLGGFGSTHGSAEFDVGPRVTDNANLSIHSGQLQAGGELKGSLVDATAAGSYTAGPLTAQATGDARVGVDLTGHVSAGVNGLSAHANGFAGAEVTGRVSADVAGVGVGASGALQAGIGAQFDGQATWAGGHIVVNAKAGAALGLGASVGGSIDVDVPKLVHTAQDYGSSVLTSVQGAAGSVEYAAGQAASALGSAFRDAGTYPGAW